MSKNKKYYLSSILNRRKQCLELTIEQRKEIIKIYEESSKEILLRIKNATPKSLEERYLKELDKAILQYRRTLKIELDKSIRKNMLKAAHLGVDPITEYFENMDIPFTIKKSFTSMFTNISDDVVKMLVSGNYYKDGKGISARIWNITGNNGKEIDFIIKKAIAEQKSTNDLAKELQKHILKGVGRPQVTHLKGISSDISYQAVRLARTSISHTMVEASVQAGMNNPFNMGMKWNLSSEHFNRLAKFGKTSDICDTYANQDLYGLGEGVYYPKNYPIGHPNCLCYPTEVLLPLEDASNEIIAWLNGSENYRLDEWARKNGFDI